MGGAIVTGCILVSCLLWCNLSNLYLLTVVVGMTWFGAIGLMDDLAKTRAKSGNQTFRIEEALLQASFAALWSLSASPFSPPPISGNVLYSFSKTPLFTSLDHISLLVLFRLVWELGHITAGSMDCNSPSVFRLESLAYSMVLGNKYGPPTHFQPPGAGCVFASAFAALDRVSLVHAYCPGLHGRYRRSLSEGAGGGRVLKQEALFLILGGCLSLKAEIADSGQDRNTLLGREYFLRAPLHHQMQHKGLAETKVSSGSGSPPLFCADALRHTELR